MLQELKTVAQIALAPIRGATHAERLESFYSKQSDNYDAFREKLLPGRQELFRNAVAQSKKGVWVDIGAGTGRNLEFVAEQVPQFQKIILVDLSPSLLAKAKERISKHGWTNVECLQTDATDFRLDVPADLITFSYSLSMIPDWFKCLENALLNLKAGGVLASVDFFVSRKYAATDRTRHGWWTRTFWPAWFAADNVHLNSEVLEVLRWKLEQQSLEEGLSTVPYVPLGKVPFYRWVGKKR